MKQLLQVARVIQTSVDMRAMRFACRIIASTIRIMRSMSSSAENGFTFFRSRTTFDDRNDATKTKLQPLVPNSASPVDPVCLSPHQQPLSVPVLAAEPDWRCRLSAEWRLQRTCCLHFAAATNKLSTMALRVFSQPPPSWHPSDPSPTPRNLSRARSTIAAPKPCFLDRQTSSCPIRVEQIIDFATSLCA